MAAVFEARQSGRGQVVDVGMVDGAASLMTPIYGLYASGYWTDARASNILDGAAPFYGAFECADGTFVSIGSIEPRSEEHTSELQSLMRNSYAVFCLKKKN